jgi:hypothetical protein
MRLRHYCFILAVLPLLVNACGGKDVPELPPPVVKPDTPSTPDDPDEQKPDDTPKPWDENRGKVVVPSGSKWVSKTIEEGIVYYSFSGKDDISGQTEEVFAVDVDLSNPKYRVKLVWCSPAEVASSVQQKYNAIATMNADYEVGSIYIKVDGSTRYRIPNTTIGTTGVPNWKSEGAFQCDGERNVKLMFAGSSKRDGLITGIEGGTVSNAIVKQRAFYDGIAGQMPHLISSAPMLINDFEPLGENFCDYTITAAQVNKLNSEDPERHQRARHPRSAVALTENNHLILFVVDGRQTSKGMSCRELTRFLVKWFNPQYALNMDGGGSSTLCVQGEGDPTTHVVNYPCDNSQYDHAGERARDVFFIVQKK